MIKTTDILRKRFEQGFPFVDSYFDEREIVADECEYENDVLAVRGREEFKELMSNWSQRDTKERSHFEFNFETIRSASVEPGTLLIQWKATWEENEGKKKKFTNTLLDKMRPRDSVVSLKKELDDEAFYLATSSSDDEKEEMNDEGEEKEVMSSKKSETVNNDPFQSVFVYGVTTYKVNNKGKITRRVDKIDFRFADSSFIDSRGKKNKSKTAALNVQQQPNNSSNTNKMSAGAEERLKKLGYVTISNDEADDPYEEQDFYSDLEAKRAAEDIAATMFYNALSPPNVSEWSWFLETTIELEYQSFTKSMGDESTGMLSKDDFIKYVLAVATFGFFVPTILICVATWQMLTGGTFEADGGLSQSALDAMEPYDRAEYLSSRAKENKKNLNAPAPEISQQQPQISSKREPGTMNNNYDAADQPAPWNTQVWIDIIRGRVGA